MGAPGGGADAQARPLGRPTGVPGNSPRSRAPCPTSGAPARAVSPGGPGSSAPAAGRGCPG